MSCCSLPTLPSIAPTKPTLSNGDEDGGNHQAEDDNADEEDDLANFFDGSQVEDEDVYEEVDDWGTVFTSENKGIYGEVASAVSSRAPTIQTDYALTAWILCVRPDIQADAKDRLSGDHRNRIEKVVRKLLSHDVDGEEDGKVDEMVDCFWDEYEHFQKKTGPYL